MFARVQNLSPNHVLNTATISIFAFTFLAILLGWQVFLQLTTNLSTPSTMTDVPLTFVADAGRSEAGSSSSYMAHIRGGSLQFNPEGVALHLPAASEDANAEGRQQVELGIAFVGAAGTTTLEGGEARPGTVNYLIGDDPNEWRVGLESYGRVTYRSIYPGIDLTYEGGSMEARSGSPLLKGTYTVAPGADPSHITWRYTGAQSTNLDASGNLVISVQAPGRGGDNVALSELAPIAWQDISGKRMPVDVRYTLGEDSTVGFALGSYDTTLPLVIDPVLTYSTYLGGNFAENGMGIAVDPAGNFYVTGYTNSSNFPTVNALQGTYGGIEDVYVAKFNPEGQPVYITYLGGSHWDFGNDIAVDGVGNAYVTGYTLSENFPLANALQGTLGGSNDAFISKLNPSGSALVFSTYLGGSDDDYGDGIAVDSAGNVFVSGSTTSTNFPVSNAYQSSNAGNSDSFVTKLNAAGSALVWSTYLGGSSSDAALSVAVDGTNNVLVTGRSYSEDYPLQNAYQSFMAGLHDVVVTKFNAAGSALIYSTYFGGQLDEVAQDIATDPAGNAYIAGYTGSSDFPTINAFQAVGGFGDAIVAKFDPAGVPLYSTYLGGPWPDGANSIAANAAGETFVIGSTQSDDFPLMNPIYPILRGSEDAFITRFSASGTSLIFSTFFGGTNGRELQAPAAIAIDSANTIYFTGSTEADDWPITANAFQPFPGSAVDSFVSRISESSPTPTATATGSPSPSPTACVVGDYVITEGTGSLVPGTTYVPNTNCGNCVAGLVLPFPVRFYDQTFTQAWVSASGNLQFSSDNHLPFNYCLPSSEYNNAIFAFWDDMDTFEGIYTSISGTSPNRIFNIEWRGTSYNPGPDEVNFEIRLYEGTSGTFEIIYGLMEDDGETATIGVQRDTGSRSTQYSCNTDGLTQGLKLTFTLPSGCLTPSATAQTPTQTATVTATPPALLFSTYYGSFERDSIEDIAQDGAGNIYVMGSTFQNDIDFGDIYVSKFTPNGQQLLWTQIVGGTRVDYGYALAVDAAGNATVGGIATSFDYPLLNPIQSQSGGGYDGVLTKFSPTGQMIFSTYFGGNGSDYIERMATDAQGNVYLTGHTSSTDFRTTPGAFQPAHRGMVDGYVTKLSPDGSSVIWSTYLGGIYGDEVYDITLDGEGNIYLTGHTVSPDYPTLNAYQPTIHSNDGDAFVTKMNPNGTGLIYSTFLGGTDYPRPGEDKGQGITVDASGHAYVTGFTESPDFPTTAKAYQRFFRGYSDAFITKFTPAGNDVVYSTLFGGTLEPPFGEDIAYDIAVDGAGQAHITGKTYTPDFPIVNAVQSEPGDVYDAFVAKFNASGSGLFYSTYLGGDFAPPEFNGQDSGTSIMIDGAGNAVVGGGTNSYNFPVINAYQFSPAGASDGFIAKIGGSNPVLTPTPTSTVQFTVTSTPTITPSPTVCGFAQPIVEGFESGTLGAFVASSEPTTIPGWRAANNASHTGAYSAYAPSVVANTDFRLASANAVSIPSDVSEASLSFWHRYSLEAHDEGSCSDGAVFEYSTDGGATWLDAEAYLTNSEYDGIIAPGNGNPLGGRRGWCGERILFSEVTMDLMPFAGEDIQFRFREGNDGFIQWFGWWVDDVTVSYTTLSCPTATATSPATSTVAATQTPIQPTQTPGGPTATATNPPGSVTATGVVPTATACSIAFTDVLPDHTFYSYVRCLACLGIVNGYPDGTFRPGELVSRGQLSKIVAESAGFSEPVSGQTFEDVQPGSTFYEFIERLASRDVMNGYPCGGPGEPCMEPDNRPYFRPGQGATRGQLTKIVSNAAEFTDPIPFGQFTFADAPEGSTFHIYIERLLLNRSDVMNGYPCGGPGEPCDGQGRPYFRPSNSVTRGQASKIVVNTFFPGCPFAR